MKTRTLNAFCFCLPLMSLAFGLGSRLVLPQVPAPPVAAYKTLNAVSGYGADSTGKTYATANIQKAIDACGPGDTLLIPAGTYLMNSGLELKSDLTVVLSPGALVRANTKNVWVKNGSPLFGAESVKNIVITSCVFESCRGLALETVDGAALEDIVISNITMRDVRNAPLFIRLGARQRGPENFPYSQLHRVAISNITASDVTGSQGAIISGIPGHDIEDLTLSNLRFYFKGGGTKAQAAREVPALINDYPDPGRFGVTPAYGFFIRNVTDLKMSNVEVSYSQVDLRPAFVLDHVNVADFQHVRAQKAAGTDTFAMNQVTNFSLFNSDPLPNTKLVEVDKKQL